MLKNAVDGLPELRNVKTTVVQLHIVNGQVFPYDGYVSLLHSIAQSYDTNFSTRMNFKD